MAAPSRSILLDERAEETAIVENSAKLRQCGHRIIVLPACGIPSLKDFLIPELQAQAGEELSCLLLAFLTEVDSIPFDETVSDSS